jgi:hypothetical protein
MIFGEWRLSPNIVKMSQNLLPRNCPTIDGEYGVFGRLFDSADFLQELWFPPTLQYK